MPTEFKLPELGENIAAGDVVRVLVKPGDTIEKDQPVLELETDKATIEVPSSVAGTVGEVRVKPGEKVKVGQVVLTVADGAAAKKADAPKAGDKKAEPSGAARPRQQPADCVRRRPRMRRPRRAMRPKTRAARNAAQRSEGRGKSRVRPCRLRIRPKLLQPSEPSEPSEQRSEERSSRSAGVRARRSRRRRKRRLRARRRQQLHRCGDWRASSAWRFGWCKGPGPKVASAWKTCSSS